MEKTRKMMGKSDVVLASISGKPITKYGMFSVSSRFGSAKCELFEDRIVGYADKPLSALETTFSLSKVESMSLVHGRNGLWLSLGILTIRVFGLGLIFILLYFLVKERHFLIQVGDSAFALRYDTEKEEVVEEFIDAILEQQKMFK